jgi:release factor glutamine methyltransferase
VLDDYDWHYRFAADGLERILPSSTYSWAPTPLSWRDATVVELCWGVAAAPLPSRVCHELELSLWNGASTDASGWLVPEIDTLAVYLLFQAARDPSRRRERLRQLAEWSPGADWERIEQIAARVGVRGAFQWFVDPERRSRPPIDGVASRTTWRIGSFLTARVRPRRVGRSLAGEVGFGTSRALCRFGGIELLAGPGAFVPEVPSERLVTLALEVLEPFPAPVVAEPGTGCGAISLAIADGHPGAEVHAVEKYGPALRWARRNVRRLQQARVHLHRGSLLDPLPQSLAGRVALVVANLPYVPGSVWGAKGRFAREAIRGHGDDGLDLYRRLVRQAASFLQPGGYLILEMGPYQVDAFRTEVGALGYRIERVEPEILGAVVVVSRLEDGASDPAQ